MPNQRSRWRSSAQKRKSGQGKLEIDVPAVAGHPRALPPRFDVRFRKLHPFDVERREGVQGKSPIAHQPHKLGGSCARWRRHGRRRGLSHRRCSPTPGGGRCAREAALLPCRDSEGDLGLWHCATQGPGEVVGADAGACHLCSDHRPRKDKDAHRPSPSSDSTFAMGVRDQSHSTRMRSPSTTVLANSPSTSTVPGWNRPCSLRT